MGLSTDFIGKRTPHLTAMLVLGGAFVGGNLGIFLTATLKEMQAKSHTPGGIDMFDLGILVAGIIGSVSTSIAAYMNRGYTRYADERDRLNGGGAAGPPPLPSGVPGKPTT